MWVPNCGGTEFGNRISRGITAKSIAFILNFTSTFIWRDTIGTPILLSDTFTMLSYSLEANSFQMYHLNQSNSQGEVLVKWIDDFGFDVLQLTVLRSTSGAQ